MKIGVIGFVLSCVLASIGIAAILFVVFSSSLPPYVPIVNGTTNGVRHINPGDSVIIFSDSFDYGSVVAEGYGEVSTYAGEYYNWALVTYNGWGEPTEFVLYIWRD